MWAFHLAQGTQPRQQLACGESRSMHVSKRRAADAGKRSSKGLSANKFSFSGYFGSARWSLKRI